VTTDAGRGVVVAGVGRLLGAIGVTGPESPGLAAVTVGCQTRALDPPVEGYSIDIHARGSVPTTGVTPD